MAEADTKEARWAREEPKGARREICPGPASSVTRHGMRGKSATAERMIAAANFPTTTANTTATPSASSRRKRATRPSGARCPASSREPEVEEIQ